MEVRHPNIYRLFNLKPQCVDHQQSRDHRFVQTKTHVLHSVAILLLVEVVVKCSHVGLLETGLESYGNSTF